MSGRSITARAIHKGVLRRLPCRDCKSTENIEAHHTDYAKPLEVIWLCRGCHKQEHVRMRRSGESPLNRDEIEPMAIRLSAAKYSYLKTLAKTQKRKITNMAQVLLEEGLERNGYKPEEK